MGLTHAEINREHSNRRESLLNIHGHLNGEKGKIKLERRFRAAKGEASHASLKSRQGFVNKGNQLSGSGPETV